MSLVRPGLQVMTNALVEAAKMQVNSGSDVRRVVVAVVRVVVVVVLVVVARRR